MLPLFYGLENCHIKDKLCGIRPVLPGFFIDYRKSRMKEEIHGFRLFVGNSYYQAVVP